VDDTSVLHLGVQALVVAVKIGAPVLVTSIVVGFAISLVQSVTQIQEVTLTFVPKLVAVAVVLVVAGRWMLGSLVDFTHTLYAGIPSLVGS